MAEVGEDVHLDVEASLYQEGEDSCIKRRPWKER